MNNLDYTEYQKFFGKVSVGRDDPGANPAMAGPRTGQKLSAVSERIIPRQRTDTLNYFREWV